MSDLEELRDALRMCRGRLVSAVRGDPIRDMDEVLGYVDRVLSQAEGPSEEGPSAEGWGLLV